MTSIPRIERGSSQYQLPAVLVAGLEGVRPNMAHGQHVGQIA